MSLCCSACGAAVDIEDVFEAALDEHFDLESYLAARDGVDQPLEECPECRHKTFVIEENGCVACGFSLDGYECAVCGKALTVEDYDAGSGNLCGYHSYVADRERDR